LSESRGYGRDDSGRLSRPSQGDPEVLEPAPSTRMLARPSSMGSARARLVLVSTGPCRLSPCVYGCQVSDVRHTAAPAKLDRGGLMPGLPLGLADGSPPVLHVRGDVDMANAEQLSAAIEHAFSVDPKVVLDLGEVGFIDGAGLRVIVNAAESRDGVGPLT